jgi:predicted dehydrogenase
MKQPYRAAIVGTGRIAKFHITGYKADPRFKVVALADVREDAANEFKKTHGLADAKIYTDYRQMLAQEKLDVVSLCLWPHLHVESVRACVAAGIPAVHCEKPIAANWGEALDVAAAVKGTKTQLTINHQRRLEPSYARARELIVAGYIGTLERIEVYVHINLLDMGTHIMDIMMMLNGQSPTKWVMAQTDTREVRAWFGVPFEFATTAEIRFENGVRALLHSGDDCGMPIFGIRAIGSTGMIELQGETSIRAMQFGRGVWEVPSPGVFADTANNDGMRAVLDDIVGGLEQGRRPSLGVANALQTAEAIFAIFESSRRGARIDMPLTARDAGIASLLADRKINV